eukprot:gene2142-4174_t
MEETNHPILKSENTRTVVIVGSGAAGLSAAIEASRIEGVQVVLLEKESRFGGNSAKASSGINGVSTSAQLERGIEDNYIRLREDTTKVGQNIGDPRLIDLLGRHSTSAIEFLKSFGLQMTEISQCGGHSKPRTHRFPPSQQGSPLPVGFTIIKQLQTEISKIPSITVIHSAEALSLLWDTVGLDRRITGLTYSHNSTPPVSMKAEAVILATGGMAYDRSGGSLLAEFAPALCTLPTTSGPHADGRGIRMGRLIGAELIHMDKVQIHPTGFVNVNNAASLSKFLCPEAARGSGAIMINDRGTRFVNELGNRAYVTDQIFLHGATYPIKLESGREQKVAYLLLTEEGANMFGFSSLQFYMKSGIFQEFKDVTAFCLHFGIPLMAVENTFITYTQTATAAASTTSTTRSSTSDVIRDEFGKTVFPVKRFRTDEKLYVAVVTPVLHYTMGGLRWLRPDGNRAAIDGLFAAGEVTGGLHGEDRLAGNSLLDCVVFGRIAGRRAASVRHIDIGGDGVGEGKAEVALSKTSWLPLVLRHKVCTDKPVSPATGDLYELSFELPSATDVAGVEPGGSVEVRALINGELITRTYSPISRTDTHGHLDLWLRLSPSRGTMSRYLYFLQPGDALEFRLSPATSPLSEMRLEEQRPQNVAFIAGGAGISPILQLLREIVHNNVPYHHVLLLWGVVRASDLIYRPLLEQMVSKHPNIEVHYYVLDKSTTPEEIHSSYGLANPDMLKGLLSENFPPVASTKVILCGPRKMCQATKEALSVLSYSNALLYSYL